MASCGYIKRTPDSQSYYQKYSNYLINDSFTVSKINDRILKKILDTSKRKYLLIGHCNNYCDPVNHQFNIYRTFSIQNMDSILFIPVIHDYLNGLKTTLLNFKNYNYEKQIFVTDRSQYGRGINPNLDYQMKFIGHFTKNNIDSFNFLKQNLYFQYKNKVVIIQTNQFYLNENSTIRELINNSLLVKYNLTD